ncbi:hypothetical protein ACIPJS_14545 [Streptomyces sp. NPDC086783]|uniref:hypothetical protein n=1 Tax=Streptomyces sp. NPDC086783 TaxID=3365758 RepID=UPI0037F9F10B
MQRMSSFSRGRDTSRVSAVAEEIRRSPATLARVEARVLDVSRPEPVAPWPRSYAHSTAEPTW